MSRTRPRSRVFPSRPSAPGRAPDGGRRVGRYGFWGGGEFGRGARSGSSGRTLNRPCRCRRSVFDRVSFFCRGFRPPSLRRLLAFFRRADCSPAPARFRIGPRPWPCCRFLGAPAKRVRSLLGLPRLFRGAGDTAFRRRSFSELKALPRLGKAAGLLRQGRLDARPLWTDRQRQFVVAARTSPCAPQPPGVLSGTTAACRRALVGAGPRAVGRRQPIINERFL